ncbi:MAG: PAS domain S-box protein, partial [Sedimentisphaerales bacterium]|nr:PAS domain S-box protein [Sedimentisphaerales bacterium]
EKELRESEKKYRLLFETAKDAIFISDEKGKFIDVNQAACESLGYSKEEFMELTIKDIDAGPEGYEHFTKLRNGRAKSATFEVEQRRKDGTLLPVEISGAFFVSNGQRMSLAIARDISGRKRTEEKIKAYQEQLRSLASEMSSAEERQRCQFATDLHDNIGQLLAVINIKLGSARKAAPPGEMAELLDEINGLIVKALHCTQSLTHELYPPILYKLGLEPAVEWLLENIEKEHGIAYQLKAKGNSKLLDNDISSLLFRAVRELLINVVKHARADEVQVSIRKRGEQIKISVEDNGGGFDTSQIRPASKQAKGFGLFSLRERLSYQGGKLDIKSNIGRGTRVTITAPLTKPT